MDRYYEILMERMIAEQQRTNDYLAGLVEVFEEANEEAEDELEQELPEFKEADEIDEPIPIDELPEPPKPPRKIDVKRK